jgi:hypothetical protein
LVSWFSFFYKKGKPGREKGREQKEKEKRGKRICVYRGFD